MQDNGRQDKTRQDKTRQHHTRLDKTRQDQSRQDKTRQGKIRQDKTRQRAPHYISCSPRNARRFQKSHFTRKFTGSMPEPRVSPERAQNAVTHFVRAGAVEMHVEISREQLFMEAYIWNAWAKSEPRTQRHILCEPARSKCISTSQGSHCIGNLQGTCCASAGAPWSGTGLYTYYHPRLKMYIHWGTGPKKVYILGPFGRDCTPNLAHTFWVFWWPPLTAYIFNLLYEMRGDLPLYIMFGEPSRRPQKVARQKIEKFQTQSLSYILSCLVGCLGDQLNTIKYCMILMILQYSILHDLEVPNTYNDSLALTHNHA